MQPMPPAKSMNTLPSTSVSRAPSARSKKMPWRASDTPADTQRRRSASNARLFGPGSSVRILIAGSATAPFCAGALTSTNPSGRR
jgi:hypothetical protein